MGTTCSELFVENLHCTFKETLQRVTVGLVTMTTLQSFLFLVLTASWRIYIQPLPLESSTLCVTRDDIKQSYPCNGKERVIEAWRQIYNESVCCGPIREVMELRIQNEMSKKYFENSQSNPSLLVGESFITDCEWEGIKTPKAKLVGVMDSVPSDIVKGHEKIRWIKNGHTFTANKCTHLELEGEIFIKSPGYYIVSSTLILDTTGTNNTTTTFSHSLNLLSHKFGTTGVLMQRKRSMKESNDGVFTSFMSAVFKLYKADRISVSVSNPNYLSRNLSNDQFIAYYTYDMP